MTRADNTDHLHQAAAARHRAAHERARTAIEDLDRAGHPVTVTSVAAAASVSRSWLYTQPGLLTTVTALRNRTSTEGRSSVLVPAAQRATNDSLRQRLDAARSEIVALRHQNAALNERLARSLGDRRSQR